MPLIKDNQVQVKYVPEAALVVMMGKTGAGKTTLCNKLCGTNHESGSAKGSVTVNLFENSVSVGDNPFRLIDTPGTDSKVDTFKHALLLQKALTCSPIHTIFIVIKYDSRFDHITEAYADLEVPVKNYVSNTVVMISHSDHSKTPREDFQRICELFEEEYPSVPNIIFYSENDSPVEIAHSMYRCLSNMQKIRLVISDEDLELNFNVYEAKAKVLKSYKQFEIEIKKKEKEFRGFVESVTSEHEAATERDEILRVAIIKFKDELQKLEDEFTKNHGTSMIDLEYYTCSIQIKSLIIRKCRDFADTVSEHMSYSLFDTNDPRNLIKRCDRCGLIWYKTEGCDGVTTCGNNEFSSYYDVSARSFWRFTTDRINGMLNWRKTESSSIQLSQKPRTSDEKRKGCGAHIVWAQLPPVEEETIKELFQVKTIEEAKELVRRAKYK